MKYHFLIALINLFFATQSWGNVTVSVTDVPETLGGYFSATVVGVNGTDPTPNPCYRQGYCVLKFFTISEKWLPDGKGGYGTYDNGWQRIDGKHDDSSYRTLGEWWSNVKQKGRVGRDYLPTASEKNPPCVVVAADTGGMVYGSIISNCAKGIVQAKTCTVEPNLIEIHLSAMKGGDVKPTRVNGVQVRCDYPAAIRVETNSGEIIPPGGDNTAVAVLDWGEGYGRPATVNVGANLSNTLPLEVKTQGLGKLDAGEYSGSAIVNVSYE